jgi:glycosyltransferase involved in cell wall biosynthesis
MFFRQVNPQGVKDKMQIAFVSSCLPRKCGIATFSAHLSSALGNNGNHDAVSFVALNNNESYDYSPQVIFEIEQDSLADYRQAANLINFSAVDVVSLQHEFGLFGGPDGIYINEFLRSLKKPVVTTFHTVLQKPSIGQKKAFMDVSANSQALVVMNRLAIGFMTEVYGIPRSKIRLIPHGVSETPYREVFHDKRRLKLEDRFTILTFGFLSPNKGIETMLKALPAVVKKYSHVLYLVLGITHPVEKKHNGEVYRKSLEALVQKLGLEENVLFVNSFVDDEAMDRYVGAADLVVCPYHSGGQITSGVLSIALSKGKAIISTPYLHAREALARGRGRLVEARNPLAMSKAMLQLIENPKKRLSYAEKAYGLGRQMGWSNVSRQYLKTFSEAMKQTGQIKTFQMGKAPYPVSDQ